MYKKILLCLIVTSNLCLASGTREYGYTTNIFVTEKKAREDGYTTDEEATSFYAGKVCPICETSGTGWHTVTKVLKPSDPKNNMRIYMHGEVDPTAAAAYAMNHLSLKPKE